MRASITPGKASNTRSLKLRVYPHAEQQVWMENCLRARQWAYNFGVKLYRDGWAERFEMVKIDPGTKCQVDSLPPIKWLGKSAVSKRITVFLVEIRAHQKAFVKQLKWSKDVNAERRKKNLSPFTPMELTARYESVAGMAWVSPHSFGWLLDVPRSVLTQGLIDYDKCLAAKFEDMKKPQRERLGRGWPRVKPLYEAESFRVQLEKPATSLYLKEHWAQNQIPLGAESQGSVAYRDDLALPQKIPSLITYAKSGSGKWHASFAVKTSVEKTFQNPARTLRESAKAEEREELLAVLALPGNARALGHDPNFAHWAMTDSQDLTMLVMQPRQRREDRGRQAKRDRQCSTTAQGLKPNKGKGIEGKLPSMRAKKAKQKAASLREHGANITQDYQRKLAGILGEFYAQHHFEGTNHRALRKSKRRGHSFAWADAAPGKQVELITQATNRFHNDAMFITCASHFPSSQQCWACKTINPHVKDGGKTWTCKNPVCNTLHHRDECASKNMLDEGFRISQTPDPNPQGKKGAKVPGSPFPATPPGGGYCANQNPATQQDKALFEDLLKQRFVRCGLSVQVRSIHLPIFTGMDPVNMGGR